MIQLQRVFAVLLLVALTACATYAVRSFDQKLVVAEESLTAAINTAASLAPQMTAHQYDCVKLAFKQIESGLQSARDFKSSDPKQASYYFDLASKGLTAVEAYLRHKQFGDTEGVC